MRTQTGAPVLELDKCVPSGSAGRRLSTDGSDELNPVCCARVKNARSAKPFCKRSGSRECGYRIARRPFNLYGFPTARLRPSSPCSITRLCNFGRFHHRQSATLPLAREDISHEKNRFPSKSSSPTGPDTVRKSTLFSFENGAIMACPGRTLVWWDREIDHAARPIRPDVRSAAHDLWEQACQQTLALVADRAPAAELMENTVAQVSRYLDRIGAPLSSRKHGLLLVAYCRALRRYAAKANRLEPVGGSAELAIWKSDLGLMRQSDARLILHGVVRELSPRNRDVLFLRAAGYKWKEIAQICRMSVPTIRNAFWREVE
jgi:DNA-directed RNA polymerase specialized sigma24 family protein